MNTDLDPGLRALRSLKDHWQVDKDLCIFRERGFDWWPGDFRVSVNVGEGIENAGVPGYRMQVTTDLMTRRVARDAVQQEIIQLFARFTPSYALRTIPYDLNDRIGAKTDKVDFVSTCYINHENVEWMPTFFGSMAILQAIDAQFAHEPICSMLGGKADMSAPSAAYAEKTLDEILGVKTELYIPAGQGPSRWSGSTEFAEFIDQFGRQDSCYGNADQTGLTMETPFGTDSALIQLFTEQPHPHLGSGLLATMKLPLGWSEQEALDSAELFTFFESVDPTFIPLLGSWCVNKNRGDTASVAFSSFIPNLLFQPGLVMNVALWMLGRARWVRTTFFPDLEDSPMSQILDQRKRLLSETDELHWSQ